MRIHTDSIRMGDIYAAAGVAGIDVVACEQRGSRSRERAFKAAFSGSGVSGGQWGGGGYKSATWDEWGLALEYLFSIDPAAHCGKHSYQSAEHFHWTTGQRFKALTVDNQHKRHRWDGLANRGLYHERSCACGAVHRYPTTQTDWPTLRQSIVVGLLA